MLVNTRRIRHVAKVFAKNAVFRLWMMKNLFIDRSYCYFNRSCCAKCHLWSHFSGDTVNPSCCEPYINCRFICRLWGARHFVGETYFPFVPSLMLGPKYIPFVEIGSGHGELATNWVMQMNTNMHFRKRFFARYLKSFKSTDLSVNDNRIAFPTSSFTNLKVALFTFEWHKRYWRNIRNKLFNRIFITKGKNVEINSKTFANLPVFPFWDNGYDALKYYANSSIYGIFILFPDPWHKRKHHKRRPINLDFFKTAFRVLKPGGFILIITDHKDYLEFIQNQAALFNNYILKQHGQAMLNIVVSKFKDMKDNFLSETHYYKKWKRLGQEAFWLLEIRRM